MTQKELDIEYAKSLGYVVNEDNEMSTQQEAEQLEQEAKGLFNYDEKTRKYLSELYY